MFKFNIHINNSTVSFVEFRRKPLNFDGKVALFRSLNPQDSIPNLLKIGYRTNENSNYNYCEIVSAENNLWKQSIIELPANIIPFIRVEWIAYSGSILAVDNIVVGQRTADDETGVSVSLPEPETPTSVFSINGQKLFNMQKGINIVRYGNGSVRKILIK